MSYVKFVLPLKSMLSQKREIPIMNKFKVIKLAKETSTKESSALDGGCGRGGGGCCWWGGGCCGSWSSCWEKEVHQNPNKASTKIIILLT